MESIIENGESISLSETNLNDITNNGADIYTYPDLSRFNNIDNLLGKKGAVIILYETKQNFGHWVCLFKVNESTLEYFDSLGLTVDSELKFINDHIRVELGEKEPHLSYLIKNSNYKLIQNTVKLQAFLKDVNTCGRWVAVRIRLRHLPLQKFIKLFTSNKSKSPDFWITAFTIFN